MTNHVHLLMTPSTERGPARLMKGLGQRYVQHINRTYRQTGTLFEGRFRSAVIETDGYTSYRHKLAFLECLEVQRE